MRSGKFHEIIDDFHETQPALQIRSMDSPRLTAESARIGITTSHNLSMRFTLSFAREHHSSAANDEFRCVALKEQLRTPTARTRKSFRDCVCTQISKSRWTHMYRKVGHLLRFDFDEIVEWTKDKGK